MCLGIPGRVKEWIDCDPLFASAQVEFGGVSRVCHMACVPDVELGDYVVIHAGVAICRVDEDEAQRILQELQRLNLLESDTNDDFNTTTGAQP